MLARVPCTSVKWIFSSDPATFEARRAVAHLARDSGHPPSVDDNPTAEEILHYINVAYRLKEAADGVLVEIIAESRERLGSSVSWADIGKQLGIGGTGAQNRFKKGIDDARMEELRLEGWGATLVWTACTNSDLDGKDDVPPEQNFKYGASLILRTFAQLRDVVIPAFAEANSEDGLRYDSSWFDPLFVIHSRLQNAIQCLAVPRALAGIDTSVDGKPIIPPCNDMQPALYICYALFQTALSLKHLDTAIKALERPEGSLQFAEQLGQAFTLLAHAAHALTRPECQIAHVLADGRLDEAEGLHDA